jgi:hypothetical protein
MTPNELEDVIGASVRERRRQRKLKIADDYRLAGLIASNIGIMFSKDRKEPQMPWDGFPELFAEEREEYERQRAIAEMEAYKIRFRERVENHNRQMREVK